MSKRRLRLKSETFTRHPKVSIIIPTFNSQRTIKSCLKALKEQTYEDFEVIIIDNCSSDDTEQIAREYGVNVIVKKSSLPEARNIGLSYARGCYVLHLDSDMILTKDVIKECVAKCENEKLDAISMPEISMGKGFWASSIALEKTLVRNAGNIITPRFFRRAALISLGGSNEELEAGEDWDLWARLKRGGFKAGFIKSPQMHNEFLGISDYIMRKYRWSKTLSLYLSRHGRIALGQWIPIKAYVQRRKELTKFGASAVLGFILLKLLKGIIGLLGIMFSLQRRLSKHAKILT